MTKEIFDNQGNKIGEIRGKKSSTLGDGAAAGAGVFAVILAVGIAAVIMAGNKPAISGVCLIASKKYNKDVKTVRIYVLIASFITGVWPGVAVYYYFSNKWKDEIKKIKSSELVSD